ncbi:MAG: cytochrome c biosis protein CcmG, thiol:disulfide interchange protein DsbE [Thermoleophilaceae bacterium]|nr:cytochrome c biosis protein CcmG, thiol:disulfide interchange protein DsbE [Thermoleophilaceae bacterium]
MRRFISPGPALAVVAVLALLGLLTYGLMTAGPDHSIDTALAAGRQPPAPALSLARLDGTGTATLHDWAGKVVVLNYWASWCKPCRDEAPALQRFHDQIKSSGGTVVGVDVKDVSGDAQAFIDQYGLDYPMLRDPDGSTQREYGIEAYPETVVIDRQGRIVALQRGPVDSAWLDKHVAPLLKSGSS